MDVENTIYPSHLPCTIPRELCELNGLCGHDGNNGDMSQLKGEVSRAASTGIYTLYRTSHRVYVGDLISYEGHTTYWTM